MAKTKAVTENESSQTFDLDLIIDAVQKDYVKDKKGQAMIAKGDTLAGEYKPEDGLPLPDDNPLKVMTGLPCIPFNTIAQAAGEEDTGKSTILDALMAYAQKQNWIVLKWDAEKKFQAKRYDEKFGGNSKQLLLVRTNEILQGGEKVRKLVIAALTKYPTAKMLINWDSVGGSQSRSHAERALDDEKHAQPGQDAKENGQVMKMLVALFNMFPDRIVVLLANQVYSKIGFMQKGNKESGGKKVAYHSSLIIQLRRVKTLTKQVKGVVMKYGIVTRATVSKNHLSQGEMSVHQMDFEITAAGARLTDSVSKDQEEGDEE